MLVVVAVLALDRFQLCTCHIDNGHFLDHWKCFVVVSVLVPSKRKRISHHCLRLRVPNFEKVCLLLQLLARADLFFPILNDPSNSQRFASTQVILRQVVLRQ